MMVSDVKRLRLNDAPMIYCYTVYGALFSLVKEKDMPWIYSNFMQIMYSENWKMTVFDAHNYLLERCPFLRTEYITIDFDKHCLADTLRYIIDSGHYAFLFLDWRVLLPERKTRVMPHTTLISGYDRQKNTFFLSDNYNRGAFVTKEFDAELVTRAFRSSWDYYTATCPDNPWAWDYLRCITCIKYEEQVETSFDLSEFVRQVKCFLEAKSILLFEHQDPDHYGFRAYDLLVNRLEEKSDYVVKKKDFHLLYEHKMLMQKRITFMMEQGILAQDSGFDARAAELCSDFLIIRNLYLKQKAVGAEAADRLFERMKTKLHAAMEKEIAFLEDLLQVIDKE